MNSVAFLVEGRMEQLVVQSLCKNAVVRLIGLNGKSVSIEAIVKKVVSLGKLLPPTVRDVVVIFDRENRDLECSSIRERFYRGLEGERFELNVILGVPDKMIENWILADFERFCESAGLSLENAPNDPDFEGKNGCTEIKHLLKQPYVKTLHGPKWMKRARPEEIARKSESFRDFVAAASALGCWWLGESEQLTLD